MSWEHDLAYQKGYEDGYAKGRDDMIQMYTMKNIELFKKDTIEEIIKSEE